MTCQIDAHACGVLNPQQHGTFKSLLYKKYIITPELRFFHFEYIEDERKHIMLLRGQAKSQLKKCRRTCNYSYLAIAMPTTQPPTIDQKPIQPASTWREKKTNTKQNKTEKCIKAEKIKR